VTISIVVADDEQLIRAGLRLLLAADPDLDVVAEAADGEQAVALCRRHDADVVVMDLGMPVLDGVAATARLVAGESDHPTKVLVLTSISDDDAVFRALRAGASGFLLKHAAPRDLVAAVKRVAGGDAWIDPAVAGAVIAELARFPSGDDAARQAVALLTPREREVLVLMADGLGNGEIQRRLFLSEGTVKTHVSRIVMKTGAGDRTSAVVLAYRAGLVR
jgi:DNA-binding NarL/FixJ family response regulator